MKFHKSLLATLLTTTVGLSAFSVTSAVAGENDTIRFHLKPSPGAEKCLPYARGYVSVHTTGASENMHVELAGLPAETEFDLFVIQVPNAPFGLSWYQGDMETDKWGRAVGDFVGRFNQETFIVAPGSEVAPQIHYDPIADAETNPATAPVHTLHLGVWFNSPEDAAKAGCADSVTPFNGEHNAGIQVLNTGQFAKEKGPLGYLKP